MNLLQANLTNQTNEIMMTDKSLDIKDVVELLMKMWESKSSSGDSLSEFAKLLALREMIQMYRQPQTQQGSDMFGQMMQFAMAMKFWDMLEKRFGKSESMEDFMKYMQLFQQMSKGQLELKDLIQLMNATHDKYTQLMKEQYESKLQDMQQRYQEIINIVNQVMEKWDRERLEMFKRFDDTVKNLSSKGRFDELKKFLEEYAEYKNLENQLKDLVKQTELEKAPIMDKQGGINWEKVLYYIDRWLFGGGGGGFPQPPTKREVVPPQVEQELTPKEQPQEVEFAPPETEQPQEQPKENIKGNIKIEVAGETKKEELAPEQKEEELAPE